MSGSCSDTLGTIRANSAADVPSWLRSSRGCCGSEVSQRLGERLERNAELFVATARQHHRAVCVARARELRNQSRLADTGLAAHERDRYSTVERLVPRSRQAGQLGLAADQLGVAPRRNHRRQRHRGSASVPTNRAGLHRLRQPLERQVATRHEHISRPTARHHLDHVDSQNLARRRERATGETPRQQERRTRRHLRRSHRRPTPRRAWPTLRRATSRAVLRDGVARRSRQRPRRPHWGTRRVHRPPCSSPPRRQPPQRQSEPSHHAHAATPRPGPRRPPHA